MSAYEATGRSASTPGARSFYSHWVLVGRDGTTIGHASTPGASTPGDSTPGALPPPPAPLPVGASTPGASTPGASILPVETIPPVAVPGWIGGQVLALTGVLLRQVDIDFYRRASYMTRKMAHKWLSRERQDRAIFITQDINTNEKRTIQHSDN